MSFWRAPREKRNDTVYFSIGAQDGKLNGMQAYNIYWSGKDSDGPATIGLTALVADDDKTLVITYWGGTEEQKAHGEAISAIFNSLKPIAK